MQNWNDNMNSLRREKGEKSLVGSQQVRAQQQKQDESIQMQI